jgi:hypothetical protein
MSLLKRRTIMPMSGPDGKILYEAGVRSFMGAK